MKEKAWVGSSGYQVSGECETSFTSFRIPHEKTKVRGHAETFDSSPPL